MLSEKHVMDRCRDCVYLVEGENGEWECHDCEFEDSIKNCFDIPDEECSLYKED